MKPLKYCMKWAFFLHAESLIVRRSYDDCDLVSKVIEYTLQQRPWRFIKGWISSYWRPWFVVYISTRIRRIEYRRLLLEAILPLKWTGVRVLVAWLLSYYSLRDRCTDGALQRWSRAGCGRSPLDGPRTAVRVEITSQETSLFSSRGEYWSCSESAQGCAKSVSHDQVFLIRVRNCSNAGMPSGHMVDGWRATHRIASFSLRGWWGDWTSYSQHQQS